MADDLVEEPGETTGLPTIFLEASALGFVTGAFTTGGFGFATDTATLGRSGVWVRRKTAGVAFGAGGVFGLVMTLLVTVEVRAGTTATADAQIVTLAPFT